VKRSKKLPASSGAASSGIGPRDPRGEAVEWFVAFCEDETEPGQCKAFDAWLKASPENVQAYLQVSSFWEAAGRLNKSGGDLNDIVRRAAAETNVIAFEVSEPEQAAQYESKGGRDPRPVIQLAGRRRFALAASLFLSITGLLAAWQWWRDPVYATQIGEFRSVTLSDGSLVELNARTRVRIEYRKALRRVALLEGQALFRVAKNPARPFVVVSNSTQVRAVGTEFDVNRESTGVIVTVIEGQVAVTDLGSPAVSSGTPVTPTIGTLLKSGSQLRVSQHTISIPAHTNSAAAIAWTQGTLVFDSELIADMLTEVNRYNPRPVVIDDPKVLRMHVSGTFTSSDSAQIVRFLAQRFDLKVEETASAVHLAPR
jgi:transmembrane sensor